MSTAMGHSGWRDNASHRVRSAIRKGIGISAAASLVVVLAPGTAAASAPTPHTFQTASHSARNGTTADVVALDSQTCATMGAGAGCTLTVSTTATTAAAPTATGVGITPMAATGCLTFDASLDWGWMGITFMSDRIRVPMCWNGPTARRNGWGPDCYIYPPVGYTFGVDWCGMYNNNTTSAQAGDNWHTSQLFGTYYYWARLNFKYSCAFWCGLGYYWTGG